MDEKKDYKNLHRGLVLKYFWQVIRRFKISLFLILFLSIIASFLDIYIPLKYLKLWDVLNTNNFSFVSTAKTVIIFILILNFTRWLIRRLVGYINDYFQTSVMEGLRKQAFSYLIGHSHNFFANNFSGSLTNKISKYARSFEKLMDRLVEDGIPLVIRTIGIIIAIYTILPHRYAYVFGIFSLIFLITALIYTRLKLKYDIIAALSDSKTTGVLSDSISNHSSIQLFAGHEYENTKVGKVIEEQKKSTVFNIYLWETLGAIQSLYILIVEFVIFWIAIGDWKIGLVSVPLMVVLQSYVARLSESLWRFASIVRVFYDSFADAQEMAMILNTPYEISDNNTENLNITKGEINFNHVTYVYENNNQKVFDDFSLNVPSGQKVAIVGSSGAGKSTFVKLLMRLFDLNEGQITIDGVDISSISQKNLREQIGFVPQDPVLFHRSLMENIRYGRRDATDEEVMRAASLAHCDEFIDNLPKGYDTYVGERGIKLSGGERQRVAIARAILKDAPILVLDEATSALDSESESLIQDALHNLIKGKTVIIIAHRLSTIREMNRIIVISHGKIVEDGNHDDLLKIKDGIYKKLWDIQSGGFKIEI